MSGERVSPERDERGASGNPAEAKASFEDRLDAARRKQGLSVPKAGGAGASPGPDAGGAKGNSLSAGLRVGVEMVSALVVAVAIGWALDHWLGTRPILTAVFVLLGGAAGVANVWRLAAPRRPPEAR